MAFKIFFLNLQQTVEFENLLRTLQPNTKFKQRKCENVKGNLTHNPIGYNKSILRPVLKYLNNSST